MAGCPQDDWFSNTLPGVPGNVKVGDALRAMGNALPGQPFTDLFALRACGDINWFASYPNPRGKLANGTGLLPLLAAASAKARLAAAYTTFQATTPGSNVDWALISNELEND
jgi:hypothetical protein